MVLICCIKSCSEKYSPATSVSFHKFPENPDLRNQWIQRTNAKFSANARVCSKHFNEDCYTQSPWSSRRVLKCNALPNIIELNSEQNAFSVAPEEMEPGMSLTRETKKRKAYIGDFNNLDIENDKENYVAVVNETIAKKNRVIKTLLQKNRKLEQKVKDLQTLVDDLRKRELITEDASIQLSGSLPACTKILFKQLMQSHHSVYPANLKTFALTLNFYSPKAYNYVRQTFENILPHPRTLQKWYSSVECKPGFNKESMNTLKIKVSECAAKGKACVCALMLDEMAIHKKIEWDGENFIGYVDIGMDEQSDTQVEAKEALVFLVNCVNDRWKLPVGYFLIDGISGNQKSNLVQMCLQLLHESGVTICSVSFDGTAANLAMAMCLGTELSSACLKPSFPHPVTREDVQLFLDPPHMLKLIRNTLGNHKIFYDEKNNPIKWEHLVDLVNLQEEEGLHLATKITRRHINWQNEKMKVRLAAQAFSLSVAKALQYLRETKYKEKFTNTEPTERFIIFINDAFDILNSRNVLAKGFKAGIQQFNKTSIFKRIDEVINYITSLTYGPNRIPLHLSKNKTGFVGFITSLRSLVQIFNQYVDNEENKKLQYLLAYKCSQDHLEVFFSAVRSMGGHNNNPTSKLFQAAYKKLLIHTGVVGSLQANCIEQIPTIVLATSGSTKNRIKTIDSLLKEVPENDESLEGIRNEHSYFITSLVASNSLSDYVNDIIEYIAGFVIRSLKNNLECEVCLQALETKESMCSFINLKNYSSHRQALIVPSNDVIHICKIAEAEIRLMEKTHCLRGKNLMPKLITKILSNVGTTVFNNYTEHMFDTSIN